MPLTGSSPIPLQSSASPHPLLPSNSFKNVLSPGTLAPKKKKLSVSCRRSDYFDQQRLASPAPRDSSFAPQPPGVQSSRVFVGYSIYKGKAALTVEPKAPEFTPLDSGAFKVSKEGFILLQFAPAAAVRQYDWNRKQVFSLSVPEIGALMALSEKDSCEFFHDPFKGRSEEGKIRKVLKAEPLPDGSGHFFNLSVQNRLLNVDESIYIPITKAEFAILKSAFNFILPHLLGWHAFANAIKPEDSIRSNNMTARSGAELEWGR
ncbi:single-stranded DNA-binding protein WHY1, chloroplastic-like [Phoenix dactylifera]|uniref:Single-stranded DNA-binding protein WHY1, chloroplastic-like n=1 Tax=Phoenix dactylifera TaxID=42345 RepID=A0A8B8JC33_PHODC|nr:single-stranded DNA-binding protein WHY1, chloroplastic-like [Phoenix dactylifera]